MTNAGALMLAAMASVVVAEGAQYGYHADLAFAPAVFARDETCSELPKLCTDHAMLHGVATTLTYLCPEPTGLTTVHVTKTVTTTVMAAPTAGNDDLFPIEEPNKNPLVSHERTTTTTIKSTLTEQKTVTVFSKKDSLMSSLPTPVITESFSEGVPPVTLSLSPPSITWSFSEGVPPTGQAEGTGPRWEVNGTSSTINSTYYAPTAIYQNSTSHSGYAKPTANIVREAKISQTMFPVKGVAGHNRAGFLILFGGLMAVAVIL